MKKFVITEEEKNRILGMHIGATSRQYLKEDLNSSMTTIDRYNYNSAIQCFLNKKGVKDDSGKPLVVDGSIGRLPNSKSAQAIYKYQGMIGVEQDGVWGYNTSTRMPSSDKKLYDACFSENSGIIDKLAKGISDFFN